MASTYTTSLALQLMATGENAGTWGQITNTNLVLVQQAIAGYQAVSIAGGAQTTALVMTQNALANARNVVIKLTGTITGNQIVTVPNGVTKTWIISNGTTGAFTVNFKYASTGTGQTWSTTDKGIKILYADGSDIQVVDLSTLSGTVATAQIANFAVGTSQLATNAVTAIKITQSTITQAKLAANSVGANQIIQSTITQSKLAANSVGANQLISTGVTAATYTAATITVDADGRITAASSGSGGAGGYNLVLMAGGPSSGTYTATANANRVGFYGFGGGGGGGGGAPGNRPYNAGNGGDGGFGWLNKSVTQPFSQPYSVGGIGNSGNPGRSGNPGNAGGATSIANIGNVNGGNGGGGAGYDGPGGPGSAGSSTAAPGATAYTPPGGIRSYEVYNPPNASYFGRSGQSGAIAIFENTGS